MGYSGRMTPEELVQLRTDRNLTQTQLAELAGVHRVTIARWETGAKPIPLFAEHALRWVLQKPKRRSRKAKSA